MKKKLLLLFTFVLLFFSFTNNKESHSVFVSDEFEYKKLVAFTFDDGPIKETTEVLLDGLRLRNVKATFFVLGAQCEEFPDILKKIAEDGHQIGGHGYNHKNLPLLKQKEIEEQINKTNEIIESIIGERPKIFRPAYGNYNRKVIKYSEMPIILWSIDTEDWRVRNAQRIYDRYIDKIKDGDIVLFHDKFPSSVEAALMMIDELKRRGFSFVTIEEMANLKNIELNSFSQYFNFA